MSTSKGLSREAGIGLVEEFYKSGLTQKDFCERNNIAPHILPYWKRLYSNLNSPVSEAKFFPVKVAATPAVNIKLLINGAVVIEVAPNSDLVLLAQVIKACKACG